MDTPLEALTAPNLTLAKPAHDVKVYLSFLHPYLCIYTKSVVCSAGIRSKVASRSKKEAASAPFLFSAGLLLEMLLDEFAEMVDVVLQLWEL
jgi:hypothetical protein